MERRYSLFIVNYPVGVGCELMVMYAAMKGNLLSRVRAQGTLDDWVTDERGGADSRARPWAVFFSGSSRDRNTMHITVHQPVVTLS